LRQTKSKNIKTSAFIAARVGVLLALALTLSLTEELLLPLLALPPGIKPGFSNIAVMLGSVLFGLPTGLMLAAGKAAFAGITRGATAFLLSGAGGLVSAVITGAILRRRTKTSDHPFALGYLGVGVLGALTHTLTQLILAAALTGTTAVFYTAPILGLCAAASGALTGTLLRVLARHSIPAKR
jgi:heptaprenyl diphosphate synthase